MTESTSCKAKLFGCLGACGSCLACHCCVKGEKSFLEQRGKLKNAKNEKSLKNLKLKDTNVITSHNTFMKNVQNFGVASLEAIDDALQLGVRAIELDVYQRDKENGDTEPVVTHGLVLKGDDYFTGTFIYFSDVMEHLAKIAFKDTNDPLLVCLEMNVHGSEESCRRIVEEINRNFRSRLAYTDVPNKTLAELAKRVIILPKSGSYTEELAEISCTSMYNSTSPREDDGVALQRVYPSGSLRSNFSYNVNMNKYLSSANMVAMNFQVFDANLENYLREFGRYRFREKK